MNFHDLLNDTGGIRSSRAGGLGGLLDLNREGNPLDDILRMVRR